jgi:hypothetical protein
MRLWVFERNQFKESPVRLLKTLLLARYEPGIRVWLFVNPPSSMSLFFNETRPNNLRVFFAMLGRYLTCEVKKTKSGHLNSKVRNQRRTILFRPEVKEPPRLIEVRKLVLGRCEMRGRFLRFSGF